MSTRHDYIQLSEATTLSGKIGLILGGLPEDTDNLPSVLFITLYSALFVPIIWRIQKHTLTFGQVWKPLLVVMLRISTFALRIKLSDGKEWSQNVFVTQLILLRLGPIILTSSLLCLLRDAVLPYLPTIEQPNFLMKLILKHFISLLNLATYFAFGLTIAIAFDVKAAINGNEDARIKMHKSKQVSIWLLVAIDACVYLIAIIPIVRIYQNKFIKRLIVSKKREESKFMAILSVCTFLLVVSAFKALQLAAHGRFNSGYALVVNRKILFYCVCCAGEYVACVLLVALPWARMVPPPELIEAMCRIYNQSENNNNNNSSNSPSPPSNGVESGGSSNIPANTIIPWPQPPPGMTTTTNPQNGEYNGNYMNGIGRERGAFDGEIDGVQMRAPGGIYGDQIKEIIPKYPTLQRISIPQDFNGTSTTSSNNRQSTNFPRPLLLSPSTSPSSPNFVKDKFIKSQQSEQNLRSLVIGNSQPLPVFNQDLNNENENQSNQPPKRNSRSFLGVGGGGSNGNGNGSGVGVQSITYPSNKRASIASLSTISEVGDENNSMNIRSIYRNSIWHPRNSILSVIDNNNNNNNKEERLKSPNPPKSGSGTSPGGFLQQQQQKQLPQHNSWESTHSSTHSVITASNSSSDSLTLPPHLIPVAPTITTSTIRSNSNPLPPQTPPPQHPPPPPPPPNETKPIISSISKDEFGNVPLVTINLHHQQQEEEQKRNDDQFDYILNPPFSSISNPDNQNNIIMKSNLNSLSIQNSVGLQPKQRQFSTCSVRSHWSDDSENGAGGNGGGGGTGNIGTTKTSSSLTRFGSKLHHHHHHSSGSGGLREGKSSSSNKIRRNSLGSKGLEWD